MLKGKVRKYGAGKGDKLDSYADIKKQEMAELRRMSARESLERGIRLIEEIAKWKKSSD